MEENLCNVCESEIVESVGDVCGGCQRRLEEAESGMDPLL